MKIEQREISKKLRQLKNVVPPKNTVQNQGILIRNNMLIANNLELGLTAVLDVDTQEEFILPPKAVDMIDSLPDGIIDVHADGDKVIIKSDYGTSRFQTFPVSEFPEINDKGEKTEAFACDSEEMAEAIGKVIYACAINSAKPVMSGVLLEGDGEYLNFVACDGYRLAWNQIKYPDEFKAVVPKASLQKAFSIGFRGDMKLYTSGRNNAVIQSGDYTVYTRLLEGDYIQYRSMFKECPVRTVVGRVELLESLARSLICVEDKISSPAVLQANGNTLNISMKTSLSDFNEIVQLQEPISGEMRAGFNVRYMIDALKAFDEENVELHYKSSLEPMMIYGKTMKALVLPVRLKD